MYQKAKFPFVSFNPGALGETALEVEAVNCIVVRKAEDGVSQSHAANGVPGRPVAGPQKFVKNI